MKNSGACQPAQSAARTSVARIGPSRAWSLGSAYPRQPASSPNTLTTSATASAPTLAAVSLRR